MASPPIMGTVTQGLQTKTFPSICLYSSFIYLKHRQNIPNNQEFETAQLLVCVTVYWFDCKLCKFYHEFAHNSSYLC